MKNYSNENTSSFQHLNKVYLWAQSVLVTRLPIVWRHILFLAPFLTSESWIRITSEERKPYHATFSFNTFDSVVSGPEINSSWNIYSFVYSIIPHLLSVVVDLKAEKYEASHRPCCSNSRTLSSQRSNRCFLTKMKIIHFINCIQNCLTCPQ